MRVEAGPPLESLVAKVANGNFGALTVLHKLQWFTHWHDMLRYFHETNFIGADIWEMYKDKFHEDVFAFGHEIDRLQREYFATHNITGKAPGKFKF